MKEHSQEGIHSEQILYGDLSTHPSGRNGTSPIEDDPL